MKEILFRGKPKIPIEHMDEMGIEHVDGWVFGSYIDGYIIKDIVDVNSDYITIGQWVPVVEKSVGQYIYQKDKDNRKIFEGDICKVLFDDNDENYDLQIIYSITESDEMYMGGDNVEIMGNIFDDINKFKHLEPLISLI